MSVETSHSKVTVVLNGQEAVGRQQPGERIKTPTKDQIIGWVVQSNNGLGSNAAMVKKSFLVCGISNKMDGSENPLIRCSKELQNISIAYGYEATKDNDLIQKTPSIVRMKAVQTNLAEKKRRKNPETTIMFDLTTILY